MRRWTLIGLASTFTAACSGGAPHPAHPAAARTVDPHAPPLARAPVARPTDAAPALLTLSSHDRARPSVPTADGAPTGSVPASGGYIVRSPGAVTSAGAVGEGGIAVPGRADRRRAGSAPTPSHRMPTLSPATVRGGPGGAGHGAGGVGIMRAAAAYAPAGEATLAAPPAMAAPPPQGRTEPMAVVPVPRPVTVTVTVGTPVAPTPVEPSPQQIVQATSTLTAASVGDADRRANYLEYLARHPGEANDLGIDMTRRVQFRVVDAQGHPVNDAAITLSGDGAQFRAHTHADGSWDFYPSLEAPLLGGNVVARADVEGVSTQAIVQLPAQGDAQGPIVLQIPAVVAPAPPALDLGFVIDVTGSMGDELRYVNAEVGSIVQRIQTENPGTRVRVSSTFYRDRVDSLVVQQIPFTENVPAFANVMQQVMAYGGGDYPEDMNAGLEAAMSRLTWSEGPAVRVMVLIADAPPQHYADEQYTYRTAITDASQRGIRILPVAASGADRNVEYLFRAMGAATSTPYVYLTDDSGVGAPHMEADTDRVAVERFADLLTRLVVSDLHGEGMHEPGPLGRPE